MRIEWVFFWFSNISYECPLKLMDHSEISLRDDKNVFLMLQNPIKIWKVHGNTVDSYKAEKVREWRKFFLISRTA